MVMGPTHLMSGAAVWLVGTAIAAAISPFNPSLSMVILGTTVMAGAAIACDFDSNSATAGAIIWVHGNACPPDS